MDDAPGYKDVFRISALAIAADLYTVAHAKGRVQVTVPDHHVLASARLEEVTARIADFEAINRDVFAFKKGDWFLDMVFSHGADNGLSRDFMACRMSEPLNSILRLWTNVERKINRQRKKTNFRTIRRPFLPLIKIKIYFISDRIKGN